MKTAVKYAAIAVVLAFWGAYVHRNWQSFTSLSWQLDPVYLLVGLAFYVGFYLMMGSGSVLALRALGQKVDYAAALHIWLVALPARYLPGSMWHIAGRAYMGTQMGISKQDLLVSSFLEHAVAIVSGLIVFLIFTPIGGAFVDSSSSYFLFLIPVGLALTHPLVFQRVINLGLGMVRKQPLELKLGFARVLGLVVWFGLTHIFAGVSLFFILAAISSAPLSLLPVLIGASAFAWVVGVVSLLVPGGIGVREATIVLLSSAFVAVPAITAAAFVLRFISAVAEVVLVVSSTAISRRRRRIEAGLEVTCSE
ncbi:MAG: lysylphosphatidylglycerol synthase domain-containing protein [Chloroflexi bacterium]|nr:lysylphosphatidylglycerol synthase domain-containing protein [Chloroflexota bacterium]